MDIPTLQVLPAKQPWYQLGIHSYDMISSSFPIGGFQFVSENWMQNLSVNDQGLEVLCPHREYYATFIYFTC